MRTTTSPRRLLNNPFLSGILLLLGLFWTGCAKVYYDKSQPIDPKGWAYADAVEFQFEIKDTTQRYTVVLDVLTRVMKRLAQLIVRDGEGATKFMTVAVEGGADTQECCDIAYSIAHSPLVKTAFFASDPNWGRILAAIGYAGVKNLDVEKIQVWLDDVQICKDGGAAADYTEEAGARVMSQAEITIRVDLGRGQAKDTVYTCDLSYDYVKINADYRS